jgi:hypothetical protein
MPKGPAAIVIASVVLRHASSSRAAPLLPHGDTSAMARPCVSIAVKRGASISDRCMKRDGHDATRLMLARWVGVSPPHTPCCWLWAKA